MRVWRNQKQMKEPLLHSIEQRLIFMRRQLVHYPAHEELLHYMRDEVQQMRKELIDLAVDRRYRRLLPFISSLQIQMTPMEEELYRRLSERQPSTYIIDDPTKLAWRPDQRSDQKEAVPASIATSI